MILVDNIAHHKKFLLAGHLIGGPAGASRALAVYVAAIGYAREGLTDGIVHDVFLSSFSLDSGAQKVAKALASRTVRLFHRVKAGYKIHDFREHNGSADKLRHQRELAKERKRKQRAREANKAVENLWKSGTTSDAVMNVTRDTPRDSRARDLEKEKEYVRTADRTSAFVPVEVPDRGVRATALVVVPPETERAAPQTARHTPRHDAARRVAADGNFAVIEKLAHTILEELHSADPESPDVVEALKVRCATLAINYHATDPHLVRRALVSAAKQRVLACVPRAQPMESIASIAGRVTRGTGLHVRR